MSNRAADAWCAAQREAKVIARNVKEGDYLYRWEDCADEHDTPIDEMTMNELRGVLRERGLTYESDDTGMRIVTIVHRPHRECDRGE